MDPEIVLVIFALITVVVLAAIWRTLSKRYPKPPADTLDRIPPKPRAPKDDLWFKYPLVALAAAVLLSLVTDVWAAESAHARRARETRIAGELLRGYRTCPPPAPGMTNVMTMTIEDTPDNKATVISCARFAERKYQYRSRQQVARTPSTKE